MSIFKKKKKNDDLFFLFTKKNKKKEINAFLNEITPKTLGLV